MDSNYFKVFSYRFLEGSAQSVIRSPDDVVVSETLAKKYFGNQAALGKIIKIGKDKKLFHISGVVADNKNKTHLLSDIWMPVYNSFEDKENWNQAGFYNYIKLAPGTGEADLQRILNDILRNRIANSWQLR